MSNTSVSERPVWVIPAIGFLVGLLVGWWLIGWWLLPVTWTNALPVDLRAAERDEYISMVAESYAASGNGALARERLSSFSPQELSQHLANLQVRAAANAQQASQVKMLTALMGAAGPTGGGPTAAVRTPAPGSQPTPTRGAAPGPGTPGAGAGSLLTTLMNIATVLLYVLLAAGAAVIAYLLWRRLRAANATAARPAIDATSRTPRQPQPQQHSLDDLASEAKARWPGNNPDRQADAQARWPDNYSDTQADARTAYDWSTVDAARADADEAELVASPDGRTAAPQPGFTRPAPVITRPAPVVSAQPPKVTGARAGGVGRAAEYRALYQAGEPDYDEAFDISDANGAYLGQCGLELNDPVGRGHDQAAALQAWLWDTNDPDTKVTVLVSEGAWRDTALRDQLKGEHEAIKVQVGTEFELESYKLLLKGFVEKAEFVDLDPPSTFFSELLVRYQIFKKA